MKSSTYDDSIGMPATPEKALCGSVSAKIVGVAIKFDGDVWSLPAPNRHHHVIRMIAASNGKGINGPDVQGFVDDSGAFLTRKQAFLRATRTGQIKPRKPGQYNGNELYSEDLW